MGAFAKEDEVKLTGWGVWGEDKRGAGRCLGWGKGWSKGCLSHRLTQVCTAVRRAGFPVPVPCPSPWQCPSMGVTPVGEEIQGPANTGGEHPPNFQVWK